jgi:hypothetical protein
MCKIQANHPTIDVSRALHTQSIKRVKVVTKGMRTLGVRLAFDGNDFDEFMHRLEEATMMRDDRLKKLHSTESTLPSDSELSGK